MPGTSFAALFTRGALTCTFLSGSLSSKDSEEVAPKKEGSEDPEDLAKQMRVLKKKIKQCELIEECAAEGRHLDSDLKTKLANLSKW